MKKKKKKKRMSEAERKRHLVRIAYILRTQCLGSGILTQVVKHRHPNIHLKVALVCGRINKISGAYIT